MRQPTERNKKSRTGRVAAYLTYAMESSDKTQREIATEVGYEKANILSMLKKGTVPVPIYIAGSLAEALDMDPVYFVRLVLEEYIPETLAAIEKYLGPLVSKNEMTMIELARQATNGANVSFDNPNDHKAFIDFMRDIADRQGVLMT